MMKRFAPVLLSLLLVMAAACTRHVIQPGEAGDWLIQLEEVQIGARDFNKSLMGNPLDIRVSLLENGEPLPASSSTLLAGMRGQRLLKTPIRWLLRYNPKRNYQLIIQETAVMASKARWEIPPTPKMGEWPFAAEDGLIRFGKESYFRFSLKKVKD